MVIGLLTGLKQPLAGAACNRDKMRSTLGRTGISSGDRGRQIEERRMGADGKGAFEIPAARPALV